MNYNISPFTEECINFKGICDATCFSCWLYPILIIALISIIFGIIGIILKNKKEKELR